MPAVMVTGSSVMQNLPCLL